MMMYLLRGGKGKKRMRRLRVGKIAEAKGFTKAALSKATEIDIKTIRKICNNPHHNASLDTLDKIAKELGVSTKDLFEDDETM